jgi:hypothetical protein
LSAVAGRLRRVAPPVLLLGGFLALAAWLLGPTWSAPTTRTLGGGLGDPGVFLWFLRWTPFAAGRQISPFYSDWLNHPDGVNLMWNTWVPLPGLLLAPLTLAFGPVLSLNVLYTLGYGLSAWSAYAAIRRYVPNHGAAAAGGLVYGFSPAMIAHAHHPNLILVFLLPWLFVLVVEVLVGQRWSPPWLGVMLGLVAAAQLLIGEEVLLATGLLSAVLAVVLMLSRPREVRGRVGPALAALGISLLVFAPLAYLPLKAQVTGPARVQADITPEVRGSSDLLAVVTPNRLTAIVPGAAIRLGDRFQGTKETYLGVPMLLVAVAVLVARRRSLAVQAGFAMLVVCLLLSFGARLRIGGRPTGVTLPWTALESLPLVQNMVPSRLAVFTALFAGLLLAAAVDGLWRLGGWLWRPLAVLTAAVALAPLVPPEPFRAPPVLATPAYFSGGAVRALPRDGVALVVPFPRAGRRNEAMVWQAEAGMWFKMPGGYFVGPDPGGGTRHDAPPTTTSVILNRIQRGRRPPELTPELRRQIAVDFATWRVASVVLGPMDNREAMAGFLTDLLGRAPATDGGVAVWPEATVAPAAPAARGR